MQQIQYKYSNNFKQKTALVTPWATECPVALYSANLIKNLAEDALILAPHTRATRLSPDKSNVRRCWCFKDSFNQVTQLIQENDINTIVIQFDINFFNTIFLEKWLKSKISEGYILIIVIHSNIADMQLLHLLPSLRYCQKILAFTSENFLHLQTLGLTYNTIQIPIEETQNTHQFNKLLQASYLKKLFFYSDTILKPTGIF